ncbi:hypothetical protein GGR50DRAFT_306044 [Xylaria sp. CBS 124048]|nr:hypothetical protein GGR50DRAFT_306044 [Xylaria sp. CBS 124048]
MPTETSITTPLPAGVTEAALVKGLQNHELYIKTTCPQLVSQKRLSGSATPAQGEPCVYEVTDKRPIGVTTFKMTLTNVVGGVDAVIEGRAPTGSITIRSQWRVRAGKLDEDVEIESNMVTKKLIKSNIEKTHPDHHDGFFAEVAKA